MDCISIILTFVEPESYIIYATVCKKFYQMLNKRKYKRVTSYRNITYSVDLFKEFHTYLEDKSRVALYLVKNNNLEAIKWVHGRHPMEWNKVPNYSCILNKFEIFRWATLNLENKANLRSIILSGSLKIMKYALENFLAKGEMSRVVRRTTDTKVIELFESYGWDTEYCCNTVANMGNIELLEWLINRGYKYTYITMYYALSDNKLEVMQLLQKYNCPWNISICHHIMKKNNPRIIKWAKNIDCPCKGKLH